MRRGRPAPPAGELSRAVRRHKHGYLAAALKDAAQPGSLLVGVCNGPGQYTSARDSVTVLGAVIRELLSGRRQLSGEDVRWGIASVNAQIEARNQVQRERWGADEEKLELRPLIKIYEAPSTGHAGP